MWWNTRIRYRMDQLLYIVCLLMIILQTIECSLNVKRYDICKQFTQKRVYTAIGSRGTIYAKHDISNYSKLQNDSFHKQCSLHILSCPSCMINIRFKDVDLPCTYDKSGRELVCNSICFVEPPFSIRSLKCVNGTVHNSSIYYKSLTSQVNINYYLNRQPRGYAFTAEYLITRNTQLAEVKPDFNSANISFGGYVSTPFFPVSYPDDLTFEQVINCKISVCLIHLIFVDFQIAEESIVEFYDSNRKRLGIIGGITFRPPVVLSSGPVLYIKFFANAGSSNGYKAQYSYVRGSAKNSILKPNTNCGGFVENKGGAITMMHMVEEFEPDVLFDCIWLFRISHKYYHLKSQHLYMKVITLKDLVDSNLVIQEGLTSTGHILQWKNGSHFVELAVPIDVGYYVRLTGTFNSSSRLEIAYAAFSQSRTCSATNEFLCNNGRCIPNRLKCDGFDHCGDNSDESADCFEAHDSESEYMDKSWYAYKSNYYFPNNNLYSKRYHILLGCFIGFIIFFIIVLLAVYRIATCYHFQTDFQNRLISISQLLLEGIQLEDNSPTSERGRLNSSYLIDEPPAYEPPPDYEAPPNYEEAIKMYKELMKQKDDSLNMDSVNMQSNRNSLIYNMDINNHQISSIVHLPDSEISSPHCLCCSKASYFIQALNINNMNNCCLSKIYSLRTSTINNQY